jgi:predicted secreted Zn-dependent protease
MNRNVIGAGLPGAGAAALLCLSLALPASSHAGQGQTIPGVVAPDPLKALPNVSIRYYPVDGSTEDTIRESLDRNGPTRPDGSKAMGMSAYMPGIRPICAASGGVSRVKAIEVRVSTVVTLPRLQDESVVPAPLLQKWRMFIAALREHEAGHIRIEYREVNALKKALVGARCDGLDAKIRAAFDRIKALQQTYDRETNNGATQGGTLR